MNILTMSTKELSRVEMMGRLQEKRMMQKEAAKILGVSEGQVKRLAAGSG
jgi:predicted XRE-type DNA-binding protein